MPGRSGAIGDRQSEAEALREWLQAEVAAREAAEREIAELKAEKRHLEHRVVTFQRTLAYGLGKALIEARSFKGLMALPGRIRRLRLRQAAKKRPRVPDSIATGIAGHLRFVDEALERARADGIMTAAAWLRERPDRDVAAKGRALAELALSAVASDPALAAGFGEEAAQLAPHEPRLIALAIALAERGLVFAPAAICAAIEEAQELSPPQRALFARIRDDAAILGEDRGGEVRPAARAAGREPHVLLIAAERWRATARVADAVAAAGEAGLQAVHGGAGSLDGDAKPALVHLMVDDLHDAQDAIGAAGEAGVPVVLDLAGLPPAHLLAPGSEAARAAERRIAAQAASVERVIARGDAAAALLERLDIDFARAEDGAVAAEVAAADVDAAAAEFDLDRQTRLIGCVAGLREDPGLVALLEAAAALDDPVRVAMMGGGRAGPWLAQHAARLGIADRVHFVGAPLPVRWPALFAAFDIAVFPSALGEPLGSEVPMALAQAAGQGVNLLASDAAWASRTHRGAPPALLPENQQEWPAALARALAAPVSPQPQAPSPAQLPDIYRQAAALS